MRRPSPAVHYASSTIASRHLLLNIWLSLTEIGLNDPYNADQSLCCGTNYFVGFAEH